MRQTAGDALAIFTYMRYVLIMDDNAAHTIGLGSARLRYRDEGAGPPVVFMHGLLVNGLLWRNVTPGLVAAGHRCITPDWPLGSHSIPVPEADLTPPGLADLIAELLVALDLEDVTLVANDTGGAITQILLTRRPERIARVVLTSSDCFDRFFPPLFAALPLLAAVPAAATLLMQATRWRPLHRLPFIFGSVAKRPMPPQIEDAYLGPARRDRRIRADLRRFLRTVNRRYTLEAAMKLGGFDRPVLLAWATEDKLFPIRYAHRLAECFPQARVTPIDDSYTFVPEDQPAVLTRLIAQFCAESATT
jgi:pimeloyl-ACP methyl ester carboxylesterase